MLNRKALYEQVLDEIVWRIKNKEYSSGDLLPTEKQLSEEFSVSRNCVREAIKCLAVGGLVVSKAGKGTYLVKGADKIVTEENMVIDFSELHSFHELMEIRLLIEPEAASLAAKRHSSNQLEELEAILKILEVKIDSNGYEEEGLRFHATIMEMSGNRYIQKIMESISQELINSRRYLSSIDISVYEVFFDEHKKMFQAIAKRDCKRARELMWAHLANVKEVSIDG